MNVNQGEIILIADSGATKTDWVILNAEEQTNFQTIGLHPLFVDKIQIQNILLNSPLNKVKDVPLKIFFYGAGCSSDQGKATIREAIEGVVSEAEVTVESDLLGACRGLFGKDRGIAAILGTGSNSAWCENGQIVKNHPSLGYILGDEGSGCYLGKKLVAAYLNHDLPQELEELFRLKYRLGHNELIAKVYAGDFPNRTLASFCPFLSQFEEHTFISDLIYNGIDDFFAKNLLKYENAKQIKIRFCGSIAYIFATQIISLCKKYGINCNGVYKNPIADLVRYHKKI